MSVRSGEMERVTGLAFECISTLYAAAVVGFAAWGLHLMSGLPGSHIWPNLMLGMEITVLGLVGFLGVCTVVDYRLPRGERAASDEVSGRGQLDSYSWPVFIAVVVTTVVITLVFGVGAGIDATFAYAEDTVGGPPGATSPPVVGVWMAAGIGLVVALCLHYWPLGERAASDGGSDES